MRHPRFGSARRRRRLVFAAGVALGVVLLAGLAFHFATNTIGVRIDGRDVSVRPGTRVADLFSRGLVNRRAGNLVSARDHRVLKLGGGAAPGATVNGHPGAPRQALQAADVIVSYNGADSTEPLASRTELIAPPVRYEGSGPIQSVSDGRPGLRQAIFGSISKETVRTQTLISPLSEVVERLRPSPGAKVIALTFDDGPWPHQTEVVLKILEQSKIKATFFEIGEQAKRWPRLSKMLVAAGMALGNHTENHPNLARLSPSAISREIEQAETNITRASGQRPRYFRPPGGTIAPSLYPLMARLNLKLILWDVDPKDWKRPPASVIVSRVVSSVRPGAVVLLHDGGGDRSQTLAALPTIITQLKARGYAFVSLDALASLSKKSA